MIECPFFVLGVSPEASRADIERAAQRWLGELALGREPAKHYETPFGPMLRTEDLVRAAAAELRDPRRRAVHEWIARMPTGAAATGDAAWPDALWVLGFGEADG